MQMSGCAIGIRSHHGGAIRSKGRLHPYEERNSGCIPNPPTLAEHDGTRHPIRRMHLVDYERFSQCTIRRCFSSYVRDITCTLFIPDCLGRADAVENRLGNRPCSARMYYCLVTSYFLSVGTTRVNLDRQLGQ
jgi:hypothetical protein